MEMFPRKLSLYINRNHSRLFFQVFPPLILQVTVTQLMCLILLSLGFLKVSKLFG